MVRVAGASLFCIGEASRFFEFIVQGFMRLPRRVQSLGVKIVAIGSHRRDIDMQMVVLISLPENRQVRMIAGTRTKAQNGDVGEQP